MDLVLIIAIPSSSFSMCSYKLVWIYKDKRKLEGFLSLKLSEYLMKFDYLKINIDELNKFTIVHVIAQQETWVQYISLTSAFEIISSSFNSSKHDVEKNI